MRTDPLSRLKRRRRRSAAAPRADGSAVTRGLTASRRSRISKSGRGWAPRDCEIAIWDPGTLMSPAASTATHRRVPADIAGLLARGKRLLSCEFQAMTPASAGQSLRRDPRTCVLTIPAVAHYVCRFKGSRVQGQGFRTPAPLHPLEPLELLNRKETCPSSTSSYRRVLVGWSTARSNAADQKRCLSRARVESRCRVGRLNLVERRI